MSVFIILHTSGELSYGSSVHAEECKRLAPHLYLLDLFPEIITQEIEKRNGLPGKSVSSKKDGSIMFEVAEDGETYTKIFSPLLAEGEAEWRKLLPHLERLKKCIETAKEYVRTTAARSRS